MARGGARNRSGPQADPNSERSERRGFSLTALPAKGYAGPVPEWPLDLRIVNTPQTTEGGRTAMLYDQHETEKANERELEVWEWAWSTPQACAWSMPSESWRLLTIAMWVRTYVICESSWATAADKSSLHRFADQIGMTPAGLRENGWEIKKDELAERAAHRVAPEPQPKRERRLRGVS